MLPTLLLLHVGWTPHVHPQEVFAGIALILAVLLGAGLVVRRRNT